MRDTRMDVSYINRNNHKLVPALKPQVPPFRIESGHDVWLQASCLQADLRKLNGRSLSSARCCSLALVMIASDILADADSCVEKPGVSDFLPAGFLANRSVKLFRNRRCKGFEILNFPGVTPCSTFPYHPNQVIGF